MPGLYFFIVSPPHSSSNSCPCFTTPSKKMISHRFRNKPHLWHACMTYVWNPCTLYHTLQATGLGAQSSDGANISLQNTSEFQEFPRFLSLGYSGLAKVIRVLFGIVSSDVKVRSYATGNINAMVDQTSPRPATPGTTIRVTAFIPILNLVCRLRLNMLLDFFWLFTQSKAFFCDPPTDLHFKKKFGSSRDSYPRLLTSVGAFILYYIIYIIFDIYNIS